MRIGSVFWIFGRERCSGRGAASRASAKVKAKGGENENEVAPVSVLGAAGYSSLNSRAPCQFGR